MDKAKLIEELKALKNDDDTESVHRVAEKLLLEYINDKDIESAYNDIEKWYA